MNYSDAIIYLKENDIRKDDGTFYEFGEVCARVSLLRGVAYCNPVSSCTGYS